LEKERLIIKNFGPIKSIDLDLGKMTILIGEQASGKSTIAKVLAICRYFSYIVDDSDLVMDYKSSFSNTALTDWGLIGFEKSGSYIFYKNTDYSVEIKTFENNDWDISNPNEEPIKIPVGIPLFKPTITALSDEFKNLYESYEKLKPKLKTKFGISKDWFIPHSFLTTDVKSLMDNPFYFPTERGLQSIFSLGKRGLENIDDKLYEQLASLNNIASKFKEEIEIKPLSLVYKYEDGNALFREQGDKRNYKLSQGASGYKSALPIILGLKYYSTIENRSRTFIIEEPEQNLFPETQKLLMEFFVEMVINYDHRLLITTHSPYNLTSLENLMYAERLGNALDGKFKKEVSNIIDEKYWINQNEIDVYALKDGKAECLMNREESLIEKEYLDGVSNIINDEFDSLLDIELKIEKDVT
jgi:predicted ATPase